MIYVVILISVVYVVFILLFILGFNRVKTVELYTFDFKKTFSIIVPFRNESENLPLLLESFSKIEYPTHLFEIILVNDASSDSSVEKIRQFKSQNLKLKIVLIENSRKSKSPKKDAIETAIKQAKHNWIVTTDADCIVPKKWLQAFDDFIKKNDVKMICAPVTYCVRNSFFENFQLLDFTSLIGVTIGSFGIKKPFLCNGANLCYQKKAFYDVDGFEGNNTISSGDDVFLLEKMLAKFPKKVRFLKTENALIYTKPEATLKNLISQRIRWASKTTAYSNWFAKFVGISVLLMNLLMLVLFVLSFLEITSWCVFWAVFLSKFFVDFTLIFKMLIFTKQTKSSVYYPITVVFYPFFVVFVVFLSIFKVRYNWKGRMF